MFGILAFCLFVIAAVLSWGHSAHADAIAYAGLAALAIEVIFPWRPWTHP